MKTLLNTEIPETIKGLVYICKYDHRKETIKVIRQLLFKDGFEALNAYANIPNPESQIATGTSHEDFLKQLEVLHGRMSDPKWLHDLKSVL